MATATKQNYDPSRYSYYVTNELYEELVGAYRDWQRDELLIEDYPTRDQFRALLEREARLLDNLRYDDWLAMYVGEFIYWVPSTPNGGDPRSEIAVTFDDRRRTEDRIYRLNTGYAWSQAPPSRTVRTVSNVEVFRTDHPDTVMVRSNFIISEFWDNATRVLTGWNGHRCVKRDGKWQFHCKQVNLIDCDQSLRNPSIVL